MTEKKSSIDLTATMNGKILEWLLRGNVGASSRTMAAVFAGFKPADLSHPNDPSDFRRCLLFLEAVPEARHELHKMRDLTPEWAALINCWGELQHTFMQEVGLSYEHGLEAPKTYELMKAAFESVRENLDDVNWSTSSEVVSISYGTMDCPNCLTPTIGIPSCGATFPLSFSCTCGFTWQVESENMKVTNKRDPEMRE